MATNSTTEISTNGVAHPTPSFLDVLTLEQAADYLQASAQSIRVEAENGGLLGRLVDGEWRFVREDVIRWLRAKPGPIARTAKTWTLEREAEVEAEIAAIYEQRRSLGTVGNFQIDGDGE